MPTLSGPDNFNGQFSVAADGTISLTTPPFSSAGGTISPGPVIIKNNAAPSLPAPPTGTLLQIGGADGSVVRATIDSFANTPALNFRRADGTAAAPSAVALNDIIGSLGAFGYGASGYSSGGRAFINFGAAQPWTDAAQGTYLQFTTTANGSLSTNVRMQIAQGVVIGNPAPDPGQGKLAINSATSGPPSYDTGWMNLFVLSDDPNGTTVALTSHGNYGSYFLGQSSRGTTATPAPLHAGDLITSFQCAGWAGVDWATNSAQINMWASENHTTAALGALISFATVPNGTTGVIERMRIDHNGNVGIGTTAPSQKLAVVTATTTSPVGILVSNGSVTQERALFGVEGNTSGASMGGSLPYALIINDADGHGLQLGTGNAARVTIDAAGNVGIGTTTPGHKLEVNSDIFAIAPSGGQGSVGCFDRTAGNFGAYMFSAPGYTGIATVNNTGAFQAVGLAITGVGGNVGIGTTTPTSRLDLRGQAAAGGIASVVRTGPNGADSTSYLVLFSDFGATGNVGAINRSGTNSVAYNTTSDARLKDGIVASQRGLDALMAIKVSDYRMGETKQQGLLAQDVAKVYPEAVHEGGDDPNLEPWMLDYGRLTPLVIKGMQQQQEMIAALQAKVAALESATVH